MQLQFFFPELILHKYSVEGYSRIFVTYTVLHAVILGRSVLTTLHVETETRIPIPTAAPFQLAVGWSLVPVALRRRLRNSRSYVARHSRACVAVGRHCCSNVPCLSQFGRSGRELARGCGKLHRCTPISCPFCLRQDGSQCSRTEMEP